MNNGNNPLDTETVGLQPKNETREESKVAIDLKPSSEMKRRNTAVMLAFLPFICVGGAFVGAGVGGGGGVTAILIGLGVFLVGGVVMSLVQGKPSTKK